MKTLEWLRGQAEMDGDCWRWRGRKSDYYASVEVDGRRTAAHRLAHEIAKGPIPEGYQVDHLCRRKFCFNPEHLEAVTRLENVRRAVPFKPKTYAVKPAAPLPVSTLRIHTTDSAAERLGVSRMTVLRWLKSGELKGAKLGHRTWRIREDEVVEFMRRRERKK